MPRILGIDPGLQRTGWGIIDVNGNHIKYVQCGVIAANSKLPMAQRLLVLGNGVNNVLAQYQPDEVAIEETFLNKNPMSSLKLGHARGAIILAVSLAGLNVKEYAATLVKKTIVGVGRAEKEQIQMMVKHLLPGADIAKEDAADALAVAICHVSHAAINRMMEKV